MEDKTELLVQIAPPPPRPHISAVPPGVKVVTWPHDLLHLYSVYGKGFFDIALSVLSPYDSDRDFSSTHVTEFFIRSLDGFLDFEYMRPLIEVLRSARTSVVWGVTDNGDQCLWVAPEKDRPEQVVIVEARCSEWSFHEMSVTSFLYGILTRSVDCPILVYDDAFPTRYADMQGVSRILGRTVSTTAHFFLTPEDSVKIYENWDDIGPEWRSV